jgi:hypothetical protein
MDALKWTQNDRNCRFWKGASVLFALKTGGTKTTDLLRQSAESLLAAGFDAFFFA